MSDPVASEESADGPPDGFISVRSAIVGLALLWLAAMTAFGALQAAVYGAAVNSSYILVAIGTGSVSVASGYGSMRAFGLR
ncbi:MAG: hypothetical protein ACI8UR_002149 [Natronomonas sp.]|jgi:hypothetical protein|uniref:hypothetical protein n=1 Tax=Natronomonas sp. TaxID=2184060 RepID=UPI0039E4975E